MNQEKGRYLWIDGLKGICCLLIFIHHFICAFYLAAAFGEGYTIHTKYDLLMSRSFISVFVNGNFLVYVFCTISGFVIANSFMRSKNKDLLKTTLKRYLRLGIPVFIIGLIVWLMSNFNLFFNKDAAAMSGSLVWLGAYYVDKVSLFNVIISSFLKTPFFSDTYISNALWMYRNFLVGSLIIYFLCLLFKEKDKKYNFLVIIPLLSCIVVESFLSSFIVGYLFAYLVNNYEFETIKYKPLISLILIIAGLFFGGYSSGGTPASYYKIFNFSSYFFPHFLGALLLIPGIYFSNTIQNLLSNKLFLWLGKLSFSVYLVHIPLIYSYSSYFFLRLIGNNRYNFDCLIVFIGTLCLLLLFSYLFYLLEAKVYKVVSQKFLKEN